jgi:hypothetical protein
MPSAGFEPTFQATELLQTFALARTAFNVVKQLIFKSAIVILVFKLIVLTIGSESQDLYTNAVSCFDYVMVKVWIYVQMQSAVTEPTDSY